jgi:hypothetical protein
VNTPHSFQLHVETSSVADLANAIIVETGGGDTLRIPISGTVREAQYAEPPETSIGTFCVNQPTTPRTISLSSTGNASIRLTPPTLALQSSSPFDLVAVSPSLYPATLLPNEIATIELTPRRQSTAGVQTDEVVWATDVAGRLTARTIVNATFVENGGAIAPPSLAFGPSPVHLDVKNARTVTLQNCDTTVLTLDDPQIMAPFKIDSPGFPDTLAPNESTTLSVGFHPTRLGIHTGTLRITSPQLGDPLEVMLSGEGVNSGGGGNDAGIDPVPELDRTSFYACTGCASNHHSIGMIGLVIAVGAALHRRPRRGASGRCRSGSSSAR